jgi:hypothetical protein
MSLSLQQTARWVEHKSELLLTLAKLHGIYIRMHSRSVELEKQEQAKLFEARTAATTLLRSEGVIDRELTFAEAITIRAVSRILSDRDYFYAKELINSGQYRTVAYRSLRKFEDHFSIISGMPVIDSALNYHTRHKYVPTELGSKVFSLFTPETEKVKPSAPR